MKKLFTSVTILTILLSLLAPTSALAQTADEPNTHPNLRCEQIQGKLDNRLENWQQRKEAKVQRWERMRERISTIIEKLRAKGYDVTPLEEDRQVMEGLIDEMHIAYDNVIAKAKEARSNACSDKDVFKANMEELKELVQVAKGKWQTLTDFMKNEFIPDIKSYKEISPTPTP